LINFDPIIALIRAAADAHSASATAGIPWASVKSSPTHLQMQLRA